MGNYKVIFIQLGIDENGIFFPKFYPTQIYLKLRLKLFNNEYFFLKETNFPVREEPYNFCQ